MKKGLSKKKILDSLVKQQKNRCYLCEELIVVYSYNGGRQENNKATIDHVVPRSKGGANEISNMAAACFECNQIKDSHVMPKTRKAILNQEKKHLALTEEFAWFLTRIHQLIPTRKVL